MITTGGASREARGNTPKMIGPDLAVHPDGSRIAFRRGDALKFEIRVLGIYLPTLLSNGGRSRWRRRYRVRVIAAEPAR